MKCLHDEVAHHLADIRQHAWTVGSEVAHYYDLCGTNAVVIEAECLYDQPPLVVSAVNFDRFNSTAMAFWLRINFWFAVVFSDDQIADMGQTTSPLSVGVII